MIEEAKALIAKSFSGEITEGWTEGSIDAALRLCEKNDGLYVGDDGCICFFRYWPWQKDLVAQMDFAELAERDLTSGPIVHVVFFSAPKDGYRIFRQLIGALNPYGVTVHRFTKGVWRFAARANVRFVGVEDGIIRSQRQRQQEQV